MLQIGLRITLMVFFCLNGIRANSQNSFFTPKDTLHKGRFIGVTASVTGVWAGSITGLSEIWYKGVPKTPFHPFDDSGEWLQMDKAGHFYTAYKINGLVTDLYRWTGFNRRKSLWIGTGVSIGFQTSLELFDAYSESWGFSWSDVGANVAGSASYLVQDLIWNEERIIPKMSYHPTEFPDLRPEVLGKNWVERILKDYNGQSVWLSFNVRKFAPESTFMPKWLCVSLGYSINKKVVGSEEVFTDPDTGFTYYSQRELLLSLDIDFSQFDIKRPWLKTLVKQFNYIKVPFPTLLFRNDATYLRPIYF